MTTAPKPSPAAVEALRAAAQTRNNAYAPYSQYCVGAALRGADGRLFVGCNVENRSYGLAVCAERAALFAAVAAGVTRFELLALVLPGAQPPCGACLQVLAEFCATLPIWVADADHSADPRLLRLEQLLPVQFELPSSGGDAQPDA